MRGRYAPTPSGELHIGNMYTALLAWLQARSVGGEFILRIEDIDRPRCKPHFMELMIYDLKWFGINWDEGPDVGGPHAPYVQSERLLAYDQASAKLSELHLLYPCYCSRADLAMLASAPHGLLSEGPVYPGTCRSLSKDERAEREALKHPSLRFIMPNQSMVYSDLVLGEVYVQPPLGGDFVVRRADDIYSYQLAVVVDDAAMGITHVLRGSDLLDSTPRQLALYEALGLPAPAFAHVPLLHDDTGERLSKRHRSLSIRVLREQGIKPEQLVGAIAFFAGLHDRNEPIAATELIRGFTVDQITRQPITLHEEWLLE